MREYKRKYGTRGGGGGLQHGAKDFCGHDETAGKGVGVVNPLALNPDNTALNPNLAEGLIVMSPVIRPTSGKISPRSRNFWFERAGGRGGGGG
jgi:hypothetical protein